MPNIATPLQPSTLPNSSPTNALSSISNSNNSTNEQFSNVLARGISEETPTHKTENASTLPGHLDETTSFIVNDLSDTLPNHEAGQITDTTPFFSPTTPITQVPNSQEAAAFTPALLATNQAVPQKSTINNGNNTQTFNTEVTTATLLATNQTILDKPILYNNFSNIGRQSFDTANSAAYEKFLPFSAEINKPTLTNVGEPTLLPLSDPIQPLGLLNSAASTITQPAAIHTPHDLNLNVQVGQPKWDGEFAQKIVWMTTQQNHVAEIRLNPAHLGPVEVMLSITNDQGNQSATAQFVSSQLAVREAIEAALPKLREMMAENGIELGNVMVGADSFQQQANTEQQKHTPEQSSGNVFNSNNKPTSQIETHIVSHRHHGLVNTFA